MNNNKQKTQCHVVKMKIPTYPEPEKEKLPMYCENRIHQRTSGKVYPNAVINDVVRDHKIDKEYTAIILENDFIELIILPEIGGRIFAAKDKSNGYDFFYRQHVIKPALIGLFGSWVSGGVEFNWPLHHRPSTFMPTDFHISNEADGSVTVWLSEHEPLDRMKGMVGICVHPDKAMFETKARLYNRTAFSNSFLWWENIAVPVNQDYQIFFPPDVDHVHFHYKKSVTEFPVSNSMFNGIDYRDGDKDIRWHKNTVKSTSYFSARSNYDFFGGFDHGKNAGVIHVANHHISPGKKMFTWAYNQLSKSWEKALSDTDGAYAELMAGCYTDNQPDFAWIEPYEVKEFSQYWYPIKAIGEPQNANTSAALSCKIDSGKAKVMLYAVSAICQAKLEVKDGKKIIHSAMIDVTAGQVFSTDFAAADYAVTDFVITVTGANGKEIISYHKTQPVTAEIPAPTPVLPAPHVLYKAEDLYLAGLHTRQYRDPLVNPDVYWKRAITINPGHYRSNNELGLSSLKEGRFADAEKYFRNAIGTLTKFNPNPHDGEAYFNLGTALKYHGDINGAYDAFYKAIWNYQWRSAGYYALAQIDCIRQNFKQAGEHLLLTLKANADNQKAANLLSCVERHLGNSAAAQAQAQATLAADPLDYWALNELSDNSNEIFKSMNSDPSQTILDVIFDYTGAGLFVNATKLLANFIKFMDGKIISPMIHYTYGWTLRQTGDNAAANHAWQTAQNMNPDYCFPSRLEEMSILQCAADHNDPRAAYYLGNLLYGKSQYDAAIKAWGKALQGGEKYYALYRNLGMAYYNQHRDGAKAMDMVRQALELQPHNPQLIFELNYLMQLLNSPFAERLELLQQNMAQIEKRDDLYMELIRVHDQMGNCVKAIELLKAHTFTPCEGGEHALVELWIFAHFKLGREALQQGEYQQALEYFRVGQVFPDNLGAGIWNIAMNVPSMYYEAQALDHIAPKKAGEIYRFIAEMGIDFFTYMYLPGVDYYRAMAFRSLGDEVKAKALLEAAIVKWQDDKKKPDHGYFKATPFFLSYLEDPANVRQQHYDYLLGLGYAGLKQNKKAEGCFFRVLEINSGHLMAALENCGCNNRLNQQPIKRKS